jgi:DNA-binding MarR family transcriptional regulator
MDVETRPAAGVPANMEYRDEPAVLLLADGEAALAGWRSTIVAAGCRVSGAAGLHEGIARLDRQVALEAVLLAPGLAPGAELEPLLDRLREAAETGLPSVIPAPFALVDRIAARAFHAGVHHLCDAREPDVAEMLAAITSPAAARLHDVNKSQATARLQQLSEEVGRIATILSALSEDEAAAAAMAGVDCQSGDGERLEAAHIRAIIRARRMRDHFFRSELFADPAWDMLLDLMAARLARQRVAVSSLCIAAAVPPTTALRWIKSLCDHGLFVRVADPEDGRRVFIELSDGAAAAMTNYLKAAQRISPFLA